MNQSSNILQCLAVDDEPHALKILNLYIEKTPFLELKKATTSPWEALEILLSEPVDILFLDIQMDGLTGLQLLEIIGKKCPVILTTAYSEFALDGYDYQVEDYLLKPYSFDRFLKAVTKVQQKQISIPSFISKEEQVQQNIPDHIFLKGDAKNKFHRLLINDILYIEGLKNYVQFFCKEEKIITLQNLKTLEENLPSNQFIRIHKSYIININQIDLIDGNSLVIQNKSLPIGSSYRKSFFLTIQRNSSLNSGNDK